MAKDFNFFINQGSIYDQAQKFDENKETFKFKDVDFESFDKRSLFGTPVYSNFEIPAGEYTTLKGETISYEGVRIDTVLFDLTQERNIVRTQLSGVNGTIKQFISDGDFVINCQGIIVGKSIAENAGFSMAAITGAPEEELRKLKKIISIPKEIEIISSFLDFFDISTVVISAPSFAEKEGSRGEVIFGFQMYSDNPIELK